MAGAQARPVTGGADPARAATAPVSGAGTVEAVSYANHLRTAHRNTALRAVQSDERPPVPISPAAPAEVERPELGAPPGSVIRFETRYHGRVPVTRRIDGSGRVLYDAVADTLGWEAGLALDARCGPGHWVTFRSAGRPRQPSERRQAHIDKAGRLVIPHGIRTWLGTDTGEEVTLRLDAAAGTLQVADASVLALALDVLDRVESATSAR